MSEMLSYSTIPEEWRTIQGFEHRYEVSNLGRVRSLLTDKILSPGPTSRGYLSVVLYDGASPKKGRSCLVHHLVAGEFIGPRPVGMHINHISGDKNNNRVDNLEYVTPQENVVHAETNGMPSRRYHGSDNVNAKLRDDDVRKIKAMLNIGVTITATARTFCVSPKLIYDIRDGKSWKHVRDVTVEIKEI